MTGSWVDWAFLVVAAAGGAAMLIDVLRQVVSRWRGSRGAERARAAAERPSRRWLVLMGAFVLLHLGDPADVTRTPVDRLARGLFLGTMGVLLLEYVVESRLSRPAGSGAGQDDRGDEGRSEARTSG